MKQRNIYALLVAINEYPMPEHRLNGCINDALAIKDFLLHRCEGTNSNHDTTTKLHLLTLFDEQATKTHIIEAFRTHLAQAQEEDTALFYYCGHGAQEVCPPAFRYLEPNGRIQSIVCYDSRISSEPTNYDLADKELAYLIAEASKNNPHFVAIMDCCHSGRATRIKHDSGTKTRQIELSTNPRPLQSFVGYEHLPPDTQEAIVPKGKHILLSASRATQTAKEKYCDNTPHGVFTYVLLKVLKASKSALSYLEIMQRVRPLVMSLVEDQHPEMEFNMISSSNSSNQEAHKKFLNGQIQPQESFYTVVYDRKLQAWKANIGSIHGLPDKSDGEIIFSVYHHDAKIKDLANPITQAYVTNINIDTSHLKLIETKYATQTQNTYRAKIQELPIQKVGFWSNCDAEMNAYLQQNFSSSNIYAKLTDYHQADYKIFTQEYNHQVKKYRISQKEDNIPLVSDYYFKPHNSLDQTHQMIRDIDQIGKWLYLKKLYNPDTSFATNAIDLEVHQVLATNEEGKITQSERIDPSSSFRFEQAIMDGSKQEEYEYFVNFGIKIVNRSKQPLWCSLLFMSSAFGIDNSLIAKQLLNPHEEVWAYDKSVLPIGIGLESLQYGMTEVTETFKLMYSTQDFDSSLFNQEDLVLPESQTSDRKLYKNTKKIVTEGKKIDWATCTQDITIYSQLPNQNIEYLPNQQLLHGSQAISVKHHGLKAKIGLQSNNQYDNGTPLANTRTLETKSKHAIPSIFDQTQFEPFKLSEGRTHDKGLSIIELSEIQNQGVINIDNPLEFNFIYQNITPNELVLPVVWNQDIIFPVGIGTQQINGVGTSIKIHQLPTLEESERGFGKSVRLMFQKIKSDTLGSKFGYPILAQVHVSDDEKTITYFGESQEECMNIVKQEIQKSSNQHILIFIHGMLGETNEITLSTKKAKYGKLDLTHHYDLILTFDYESMNTPIEMVTEQFAQKLREAGILDYDREGQIIKTNVSKVHVVAHSSGGLIARQFIEKNGGKNVIDHLVMVGTPNLGTPWSRIEDLATLMLTLILSKISLATWAISPLVLLIKQFDKKWQSLDQINPKSAFFSGLNAENMPNSGVPYTIIAGNTQDYLQAQHKTNMQKIVSQIVGLKDNILDKLIFKNPNDIVASTESICAEKLWEDRKQDVQIEHVPCDHLSYFSDPKSLDALAKIFFERVNKTP